LRLFFLFKHWWLTFAFKSCERLTIEIILFVSIIICLRCLCGELVPVHSFTKLRAYFCNRTTISIFCLLYY
jgi:hypothetical protein